MPPLDQAFAGNLGLSRAEAVARALLADGTWLRRWLQAEVGRLREPDYQPRVKAHSDPARTGVVLFHNHAVQVALVKVAPSDGPPPLRRSNVLSGKVTWSLYLRGAGARLLRWRLSGDRLVPTRGRVLRDGSMLRHDGRTHAQVIDAGRCPVVVLSITLSAGASGIVREYAAADGRHLRSATHDEDASRSAMLLTLLRAAGRSDAGEVFRLASHEPAPMLRWHAMREWLATDLPAALPRLVELATGDPDAPVRVAAAAALRVVEGRRQERPCHG